MNLSIFDFMIVFAAGIALGALYFGGLWLTVRNLATSRFPVLRTTLSFFSRLAIVLLGFYVIMDGRWERLAICMLGFLLARMLAIRVLKPIHPISALDSEGRL